MNRCPCRRNLWVTYNCFLTLTTPAFATYAIRRLRSGTPFSALREWMGRFPEVRGKGQALRFWVHAVSVGEVIAASGILSALKKRFPSAWVLVSTVTEAGRRTAEGRLQGADALAYLPFDLYPFPFWAMERVQPDALLLVETELWGNLMHAAKGVGARVILVNGRVSDATFARARQPLSRNLYRWLLDHLDLCLMRNRQDADRIRRLGVPPEKVKVTGDVKLDQPIVTFSETLKEMVRTELGLFRDHLLWVAGSTHEGEETILLEAYRRLRPSFPNLRLLLAPRHLERTKAVIDHVRRAGLFPRIRSACDGKPLRGDEVIVLDTVGELSQLYGLAAIAFVGGSLIPRGGHNIMEPLLQGIPVLFGPHMENFRPHAEAVTREGIGFLIRGAEELVQKAAHLLASGPLRQAIAWKARQLLSHHQGAGERTVEAIAALLKVH